MEEVGVAGHQHEGGDVGVGVGALDAVGGHFDIDAVLHTVGAHPVGGGSLGGRDACGNEHRLYACGVEGGRIVEELAGAAELGSPRHPVSIGFGDDHSAQVGDFLFEGRQVGIAVPNCETDLKVFPVNEQRDIAAANIWFNHVFETSGLDGSGHE